MKQVLKIDRRVALYGSQKQITEAEIILLKNIPELPTLSESLARLKIQDCLDFENVKVGILFDGNSVWSKKRILRDVKRIKKYGMKSLSNYLYKFLSLSCGSIAHYNKYGWVACYPTLDDLRNFFRKNECGQRVLNYLPAWKTDAQEIVRDIEQVLDIKSPEKYFLFHKNTTANRKNFRRNYNGLLHAPKRKQLLHAERKTARSTESNQN